MRRAVLAMVLVVAALPVAFGNSHAALIERERIRVTRRGVYGPTHVGEFEAMRGDTLVLHEPSTGLRVFVPAAAIDRVERSGRAKTSIMRGAGRGFLLGAAAGAVLGISLYRSGDEIPASRTGAGILCGLVVGVPTAFVGGTFGAFQGHERWLGVSRSEWDSRTSH